MYTVTVSKKLFNSLKLGYDGYVTVELPIATLPTKVMTELYAIEKSLLHADKGTVRRLQLTTRKGEHRTLMVRNVKSSYWDNKYIYLTYWE